MLIELRIENLAVIERVSLHAEHGLHVLTGETGAGKSIIVGALALLLGERASPDAVRAGAGRGIVEGVFDVADAPEVQALLEERGIEAEESLVVLRREIAAEGRSRAWVNGAASTAATVGEIGRLLVDLHGQHEHQSLLEPAEQRAILDAFAGAQDLAARTRAAHELARDLTSRLQQLDARRREVEARAQGLRLQAEEIEKAGPREDEEVALETEARRLAHAEEITQLALTLNQELYAAERALAGRLHELQRTLEHLTRLDPALASWSRVLDDARYNLEELGREMGAYASGIESEPARLEHIRRRQDLLFRLKARYGPTVTDVIATGRRARTELAVLEEADSERISLEPQLAAALQEHRSLAQQLSERRRQAAQRLDHELRVALPELGLPDARFHTRLEPLAQPGANGGENVAFHVAVNAGFEPGPLGRVASGGELSRIMLALKSALAREDRVPTLVFDEIDTGIGGRAAQYVAERLRDVARRHQVFAVTHLARIAANADHHLLVEKNDSAGRATATVIELTGDPRTREVARLLGGDPDSRISLQHARELLAAAGNG
jgi:DNA repair protein RecN (Recombination protein N)